MSWLDGGYSKEKLAAAKAGDRDAQYSLAIEYVHGDEVRRNLRKARYWNGLAAGRGDSSATCDYASMLWCGDGGPRDEGGALRLMRKASREGESRADVFLGDRLAYPSCGSAANARRAARHYLQAAMRGHIGGVRGLLALSEQQSGRFRAAVHAIIDPPR